MIYTALTKKAMKIAFEAHKNQVDKSGIPYIYHPIHLAEQMNDEATTCVALLHDVVEDTDITFEDLQMEGFSDEIMEALRLLTFDKTDLFEKDVKCFDLKYLKELKRQDYISGIRKNDIACAVKLCDLEHNRDLTRLDTISEKDKERVKKYENEWLYLKEAYIRRNCNHNYDEIFPLHYNQWNNRKIGYVSASFFDLKVISYNAEGKYVPLEEYNILKNIFEASEKFEKVNSYQNKEIYSCFKSQNGAISIHFDDRDPFDPFNVEAKEEDWYTELCFSNIKKEFIDDIISAFENYLGFKVYYRLIAKAEDIPPTIYFSDKKFDEQRS